MKPQHILLILFLVSGLQACTSISGPVHFYAGHPRTESETAYIKVPAAITVTSIDGKKIKIPSKDEGFYDIYLLPGLHRIDFRYLLAWGDNVSGMLIRSDVVGIETRLYPGKSYELVYKEPADQEEASELVRANKFQARLVEQGTGRQVLSRSIAELDDELRRSAAYVYGNTGNNQQQVKSPATEETNRISAPIGLDADTAAREDAVKRLKFWWLMANEKERQQFREWMKSVETTN